MHVIVFQAPFISARIQPQGDLVLARKRHQQNRGTNNITA